MLQIANRLTALALIANFVAACLAWAHIDDQRLIYTDGPPVTRELNDNTLRPEIIEQLTNDARLNFQDLLSATGRAADPVLYARLIDNYVRNSAQKIKDRTVIPASGRDYNTLSIISNRGTFVKVALIDSGVDISESTIYHRMYTDLALQTVVWQDGQPLMDPRDPGNFLFQRFHPIRTPTLGYGIDYVGYDDGITGYPLRTSGRFDESRLRHEISILPGYSQVAADARDRWPFPFIFRTDYFNPNLSRAFAPLVEASQNNRERLVYLRRAIELDPELNRSVRSQELSNKLREALDPSRQIELELSSQIHHGTHLAGIIGNSGHIGTSASDPDRLVKIIPFRVFHQNRLAASELEFDTLAANIRRAIAESAARGAKIVNMSFKSSNSQLGRLVSTLAAQYPEMVFVVSAGNDGAAISSAAPAYPCMVQASNLICVGALNSDLASPWPQSNFADQGVKREFVWALGENVTSTLITAYCPSALLEDYLTGSEPAPLPARSRFASDREFQAALRGWKAQVNYQGIVDECLAALRRNRMELSGTSPAAAHVTRAIAEMMVQDKVRNDRDGNRNNDRLDMSTWSGAQLVAHFLNPTNGLVEEFSVRGGSAKKIISYPRLGTF